MSALYEPMGVGRPRLNARVLMAPLHYSTGADVGGSEFQWAYEIATGVASKVKHVDAVVGRWRNGGLPPNMSVREVGLDASANYFSEGDLVHRLRFIGKYSLAARRIIGTNPPDIFHHVLPFGTETFNPIILSSGWYSNPNARTRVVIGPVQNAHQQTFSSEEQFNRFGGVNARESGVREAQRYFYRGLTGAARQLCSATLNRAHSVIAVSSAAKNMLEQLGCKRPIEVIPSGTRPERFHCPDRAQRHGPLRIIVANYLVQRKGCELILEALAILKERNVAFMCEIAGDGPERNALENQINNFRIGDVVQILGMKNASELAELYAAADVFVSMSWAEGLPTALMEAMSAGLPLVSADNEGANELIAPNQNGLLVPRGDARVLAEAVEWYSVNRTQRLEHGLKGRQTALERYNWRVICQRYVDLYEELLTSSRITA